ncbi:glycosyltransferase [Vibrio breoganii]|uniref:glycosyltransferase n=1 Tax=Vibrio breoganii TaxID=553239 RepID=UPI000C833C0E|nr:glycosyltransferase [Vibrio breoganii]PMG97747.1 hypothetical protein BCU80_18330 [Vibrio breoganii]
MNNKFVIWMNIPSIHQASLFGRLFDSNEDIIVAYYLPKNVCDERNESGFITEINSSKEVVICDLIDLDKTLVDWKDRTHIIPGIGDSFCRKLLCKLIFNRVKWGHWSEHYRIKMNWFLTLPVRIFYSVLLNLSSQFVIVQSDLAVKQFKYLGVNTRKIKKFNYTISKDRIIKESSKKQSDIATFVYLGRFEKVKGVDLVLHAAKYCSDNNIKAHFTLVGSGTLESHIRNYISQFGLEKTLDVRLPIDNANVVSELSNYTALILPSIYDGWGVVVNEALSAGIPVIVSNKAGSSDLIKNSECGFIFDGKDELFSICETVADSGFDVSTFDKCKRLAFKNSSEEKYMEFIDIVLGENDNS